MRSLPGLFLLMATGCAGPIAQPTDEEFMGPSQQAVWNALERNAVEKIRFKENSAQVTLRPGDLGGKQESLAFTVLAMRTATAVKNERRMQTIV